MQSDQQTDVFSGSPGLRAVAIGEGQIESIPVDLLSQNAQRMAEIQQLIEPGLEQIQLTRFRTWFRPHVCLKLQGFDHRRTDSLQSITTLSHEPGRYSLNNTVFQRRLLSKVTTVRPAASLHPSVEPRHQPSHPPAGSNRSVSANARREPCGSRETSARHAERGRRISTGQHRCSVRVVAG